MISFCNLAIKMGSVNVGMFPTIVTNVLYDAGNAPKIASPPLGHPQPTQHMPFDSTRLFQERGNRFSFLHD
jgi:hypothetical protein